MSREDSSVLELSIYSEASSSSGDEDEDDDLASEWSEWEDPLWVKDDNLRRPAKAPKVRSPLMPRRAGESGLRRSSTVGGGSGSAQLIVRKLSALAIAQVVVPATPRTTASATSTASTPRAKSDTVSLSTSLSASLSFEGQESGACSPLSTPTSSASTPTSSRLSPAADSLSGSHLRVPRKVTELVAQDEADDAWSLDGHSGSSLAFKSISDVDEHVEEEDQDNHQESVAWQHAKSSHPGDDDDDDHGGDDGDDGSVEEEVEAELSSDEEGGTEDDYDDEDQNGGDHEVVEEKGIEYLLQKYFPESLAAIEQEAPPEPNQEEKKEKKKPKQKKKKKKKRSHKKKEKKTEKQTATPADRCDEAQIKRDKDGDASQPSSASRLVFSVDGVVLERRDKAREKYQSLYIPSLDLRGSADDADADDDSDADAERKPSSAGEGRRRVRHRSERERRMPQSARERFGRKSARELGMIFRCRSREDVTDDEPNAADPDPAVASPRGTRRTRSSTLESVPQPSEAQPTPRPKTKHSWIIKREDHQRASAPNNGNIERERAGQVYGRLSVSTSSFTLAADSSSSSSVVSASAVLSTRKKTGSFRSLLSGRRATGSTAEAQQQQLRRDAISADHPTLASSSSSSTTSSASSWSLPFTSISSSASSSPSPTASSTSSSTTTSSPSPMRRGRSSSLNKAAGLFKRSRSLRKTRADDKADSGALASGDSRSGSAVGDQQKDTREKAVGGIKKSWREVRSYFNGSASMPASLAS